MKQEMYNALELDARTQVALNSLIRDIGVAIKKAGPVSGVTPIPTAAGTVSAVSVRCRAANLLLSPRYFMPEAQADAVVKRLTKCDRVPDIINAIKEMVRAGRVQVTQAVALPLNERTLDVLRDYVEGLE